MDLTTILTGMLPAVVIVAGILTAASSVFLLWLYRRATLRGMRQQSGHAVKTVLEQPDGEQEKTRHNLELVIQNWQNKSLPTPSKETKRFYRKISRSLRSTAIVYALGGLAYALIFTLVWMITSGGGFVPGRFLWLLICFMWPTVIAINLLVAINRKESITIVLGYFAVVIIIALFVLARNPELTIGQTIFFWLFVNLPASVLFLSFLYYRIRSVGPLVLAFMVAGVTGAFLLIQFAGSSDNLLRSISAAGNIFGLGATTLFVLMHVIGFVIFSLLGWYLLKLLGRRYREKRLSDQSLNLDALWLTFAVVQSITLVFEGWAWIFTGLVAFAFYKIVTLTGFAQRRKKAVNDTHYPMLLLLRVFALGRRSEKFFDGFSKLWRQAGSIDMIAGPDLVTTAVEPHEFLDFVSGKMSRQFVKDERDLEQRISALDKKPDPDQRLRVNEFFCHDDTWQMTMLKLATESDAILMDLRSFSQHNQGCLYELEQLLNQIDLDRIVFMVDQTTDLRFLEDSIQALWKNVDSKSPNLKVASPVLHLFHAKNQNRRTVKSLIIMLLGQRAAA
ncbi:MAG TPA: hypothetical protein EYH06_08870 [Chromatiales bacterium]|nr:hypothetical protein [Chromatiales bacterium]